MSITNAIRRSTLATCAALAVMTWALDASAMTPISSCPQKLGKAGETYYLTADLRSAGSCLTVTADRITVDLKGHSISGDGSGAAITDGGAARLLVVVKNGSVDSFGTGVDLRASSRSEVRGVNSNYNSDDGIVGGARTLVKGAMVGYNGGTGVIVGEFSQVQECLVYSNGEDGIKAGDNSLLNKNLAQSNVNGMTVGQKGTVSFNLAGDNSGYGIHAGPNSQVSGNTVAENGGVGIWASCPSTVSKNESWDNAPNYSRMDGCRASSNQ